MSSSSSTSSSGGPKGVDMVGVPPPVRSASYPRHDGVGSEMKIVNDAGTTSAGRESRSKSILNHIKTNKNVISSTAQPNSRAYKSVYGLKIPKYRLITDPNLKKIETKYGLHPTKIQT